MGWRFKVTVIAILLAIGGFSTTVYVLGQRSRSGPSHYALATIPRPSARGSTLREQESLLPTEFFRSPQLIAACDAISAGDHDRLQELIAAGLDVNSASKHGVTLLHWAVFCEELPAFRQLLAAGADPDVKSTDDRLLTHHRLGRLGRKLLFGLISCDLQGKWEFFFAALDHTSDPQQQSGGYTLLHAAVHGHATKYSISDANLLRLLAAKVDLDAKDPHDNTAAMNALSWDRPGQCLLILKAGANPDLRGERGSSIADILAPTIKQSQAQPSSYFNDYQRLRDWLDAHEAKTDIREPSPAADAP